MNHPMVAIAGCEAGSPDCAAGTVPPGIDTWYIVLVVVLVMIAVAAVVALLARRRTASRTRPAPGQFHRAGRAR